MCTRACVRVRVCPYTYKSARPQSSLATYYSASDLEAQLNARFFELSGHGYENSSEVSTSEVFRQNSQSSLHLKGGNTSAYLPQDWNEWIHTVYFDPVPLSSVLVPVSTLLANASLRANVDRAVEDYVTSAGRGVCASDLCQGHGSCDSAWACVCDAGFTGPNCTAPKARELLVGPFCRADADCPSAVDDWKLPEGVHITALTGFSGDGFDLLQVFASDGSSHSFGNTQKSPNHGVFTVAPGDKLAGASGVCYTENSENSYFLNGVQFSTALGNYSDIFGRFEGTRFPWELAAVPGYEIVGLRACVGNGDYVVVDSLSFYLRKTS